MKFSQNSVENSKPISEGQLKASAQVVDEQKSRMREMSNGSDQEKCGWITLRTTRYWFVLDNGVKWFNKGPTLTWYRDDKKKKKVEAKALKGASVAQSADGLTLTLKAGQKYVLADLSELTTYFHRQRRTTELTFESSDAADMWKGWEEGGRVRVLRRRTIRPIGSVTLHLAMTTIQCSTALSILSWPQRRTWPMQTT